MTLPGPIITKASGGVMAEGKEASCERGPASQGDCSAKGADRRNKEINMTKTLSEGELVAELVAALRHALKLLEPFDDPELSLGLGSNALAPIRAALSKAEAESAGEKKCACGAMSGQDCDDLPSLRHCGGAEATSAPTPAPVSAPVSDVEGAPAFCEKYCHEDDRWCMRKAGRQCRTALRTPHGLPGEEALRKALSRRAFVMSGPDGSGWHLRIGFEKLEDVDAAHKAVVNITKEQANG